MTAPPCPGPSPDLQCLEPPHCCHPLSSKALSGLRVFLGVFLCNMNTLTSTAEKMASKTNDVVLVYVATVFLHYHKAGSWSSNSVGASRLRRNKYLIAFTCASVSLALLSPKQFAFAEHISVSSVFSLPPVCWTMRQPTAHFYLSLKQLSF